MRRVEVVKVRKPHTCEACNGTIKKGELAFVVSRLYTGYQRFPEIFYYHHNDKISPEEFEKMSWNEIRGKICNKRK